MGPWLIAIILLVVVVVLGVYVAHCRSPTISPTLVTTRAACDRSCAEILAEIQSSSSTIAVDLEGVQLGRTGE